MDRLKRAYGELHYEIALSRFSAFWVLVFVQLYALLDHVSLPALRRFSLLVICAIGFTRTLLIIVATPERTVKPAIVAFMVYNIIYVCGISIDVITEYTVCITVIWAAYKSARAAFQIK